MAGRPTLCLAHVSLGLAFGDSLVGASLGARAAADAHIGIDAVDVTFADCACRANRLASATSHTVVINYVCHFL